MNRETQGHTIWDRRFCGTLMPLFSLPGPYGIGDMGSAKQFIHWLQHTGQSVWQLLPLGPVTGYCSPYQAQASSAGALMYVDLEDLKKRGWLKAEELKTAILPEGMINYGEVMANKEELLAKAYHRGFRERRETVERVLAEWGWLRDYAIFHLLWKKGKLPIKRIDRQVLTDFGITDTMIEEIAFYQVIWREQWSAIRAYAHEQGVLLLGDMPIYVSADSMERYLMPEYFEIDEEGMVLEVGGCPPDAYTGDGQLWGNPIYCWAKHEADDFQWWGRRLKEQLELYDMVRLDHFRGFCDYWSIPRQAKSAAEGQWKRGPREKFFQAMEKHLGTLPLIVEDLGYLTEEVHALRRQVRLPGMEVIQFAFDEENSNYLPHHYEPHTMVYTGTHDNPTTKFWYESLSDEVKDRVHRYTGAKGVEDIVVALIRAALTSVGKGVIIPMADWLNLGEEGRINIPGEAEAQWRWRVKGEELENLDFTFYRQLIRETGRAT